MDAVTAVSGSGPAYVFLLAEALARAGAAAGLPPELAATLARATVAGSGELLHRSPLDAATLRQNVTSPGGTTAAALDVLMAQGRPRTADDQGRRRRHQALARTRGLTRQCALAAPRRYDAKSRRPGTAAIAAPTLVATGQTAQEPAMARKPTQTLAPRRRDRRAGDKPDRDRIIDAFMALLAEKPIEQIGFAEIAERAGVSLSDLRDLFGSTLAILAAHMKEIDRAVLAGGDADMAEEPPRERLFDVLMRRLEALAPHKEAVRSLTRSAMRNPASRSRLTGLPCARSNGC